MTSGITKKGWIKRRNNGFGDLWNKGLKVDRKKFPKMGHLVNHSKLSIEKIKKSRGGGKYSGNKHPGWKGGLTRLQKKEMIAGRKKPKVCELCGKKGRIVFDHNHKTGEFRGWLCNLCNTTLGALREDCVFILKMIDYIKNDGIK